MGIDNFGKVSFTSETKAAEFVTYLEQGKVMATTCRESDKAPGRGAGQWNEAGMLRCLTSFARGSSLGV